MANITVTMSVDKTLADIDDILIYTIILNNTGNATASDIILIDPSPIGTEFIKGTVKINDIVNAEKDPRTSCNVGSMEPGATIKVEFNVQIKSLVDTILNSVYVNYRYEYLLENIESNSVATQIKNATIVISQTVDKTIATISDILSYNIVLTNKGNIDANNVQFTDNIPTCTSIVADSLVVDGTNISGSNPLTDINLETINTGTSKTISFKLKVNSMPISNPIENECFSIYDYKLIDLKSEISNSSFIGTYINVANLNVIEERNKNTEYVTGAIKYNIKYTVYVINTGNITAQDVNFQTEIQYADFQNGSVGLNGTIKNTLNPLTGFSIGNIKPGEKFVVEFKAVVNSVPIRSFVSSKSTVSGDFLIDPSNTAVQKSFISNLVSTKVGGWSLPLISSDKPSVKLGDELTYEITVSNTSSMDYTSVIVNDIIPTELNFIPGSIIIDTTPQPNLSLNDGVNLGDIIDGASKKASFKVTVVKEPIHNIIYNNATVQYSYRRGDSNIITFTLGTETISTYVFKPNLTIKTGLSDEYVYNGDIVNCFIIIKNTGDLIANNVVLNDTLSRYLTFIPNSVVVNSTSYPLTNITTGIDIGNMNIGDTARVAFAAKVNGSFEVNNINNRSSTTATFNIPFNTPEDRTFNSNVIIATVIDAKINVVKSVDKSIVQPGQNLIYNIKLSNIGKTDLSSVYFFDNLANDLTFVSKSVKINGIDKENFDPTQGFEVGPLSINSHANVLFTSTVNKDATSSMLENSSDIDFQFIVNPAQRPITKQIKSNAVITDLDKSIVVPEDENIVIIGSADKKYAELNSVITYTIVLQNISKNTIDNISFISTITSNISFVSNSLLIDDIVQPGINPTSVVNIGNIASSQTKSIVFKVLVNNILNGEAKNIPHVYYESQKPKTIINGDPIISILRNGSIIIEQHTDKDIVGLNEELSYNIMLNNIGNISLENLVFRSDLSSNVQFIPGSFMIGNRNIIGEDLINGVILGIMLPGDIINLSFRVKVISDKPSVIEGQSSISYTFISNPEENNSIISKTIYSNITFSNIKGHELTLTKNSNKSIANPGEIIKFKVDIKNNRNVIAFNILFVDVLTNNLELVLNSFKLNGIVVSSVDMNKGVEIGDIPALGYATIEFEVKVKFSIRPPRICNIAYALANYKDVPKVINAISNTCRVIIGPIKFYKFNKVIVPYLP